MSFKSFKKPLTGILVLIAFYLPLVGWYFITYWLFPDKKWWNDEFSLMDHSATYYMMFDLFFWFLGLVFYLTTVAAVARVAGWVAARLGIKPAPTRGSKGGRKS